MSLSRAMLMPMMALGLAPLAGAQMIPDRVAFRVEGRVLVWDMPAGEEGTQRFLVASNAAFAIDAALASPEAIVGAHTGTLGFDLRVALSVPEEPDTGMAAQYPHSAGPEGGMLANGLPPSAFASPVRVFLGDQRTARVRGTPRQQAVCFEAGWIAEGERASQPTPALVFTVYVP